MATDGRRISIVDYDPQWPGLFRYEAERIRATLGNRVLQLEHAGSTSVPGLAAKPIVDITLVVADSSDEDSYVQALEGAGYVLRIREPEWHEHRMFNGPDTDINLHVFSSGGSEVGRILLFRDWLRTHPADRDLYARTKRELALREWDCADDYAAAKTAVIAEILGRAARASPPDEGLRPLILVGMLEEGAAAAPAILVRGLKKYYGTKPAVDGVDLEVPRGSFFGFLGPNGAGKSTTIRILTGLIPYDSGAVEILGYRLPEQDLEIKRRVGLVPDESLLFDRLTGVEFLEFVGRMYGLARPVAIDRAQGLMDLFQLHTDRKIIAEYSKGMRKRVAMAASLIHHPELFLMDEPFEGVDAVGARLMKDILIDQVHRGATIFLTSHVLEVVERLCDRVAIINDGRIAVCRSMAELRSGGESLEDAFVRIVGAEHQMERLDWL